jgi:hypothetical protein
LDKRAKEKLRNAENKEKGRIRREKMKADKEAALAALGGGSAAEETGTSVAGSDAGSSSGSTRIKISRASLLHDAAPIDPLIPEVDGEQDPDVDQAAEGSKDVSAKAPAVTSSKPESSRKRKRTVTPSQMDGDVALTVADVGTHDTFKMFESGWILPEGSSRRTAKPPVELHRSSSPVKNKRQRTSSDC